MNNSDMPAMPVLDSRLPDQYFGLTKREAFAMAAMQGLMANSKQEAWFLTDQQVAQFSVDKADALLAALEQEQ